MEVRRLHLPKSIVVQLHLALVSIPEVLNIDGRDIVRTWVQFQWNGAGLQIMVRLVLTELRQVWSGIIRSRCIVLTHGSVGETHVTLLLLALFNEWIDDQRALY